MAGLSFQSVLFAAAIVLMPLSYATKSMLGMPGLLWIDPTLILGALIMISANIRVRPRITVVLVALPFISATIGGFWLAPPGAYSIVREPIRLALNMVWFWVCLYFIEKQPAFTVRWLSIAVILQLLIALWLWVAFRGYLPLLGLPTRYVHAFSDKQLITVGSITVQRLLGTFGESPPFGLFMFSSFVVFFLKTTKDRDRSPSTRMGLIISLIGIVGSISDQVLLAIALIFIPTVFMLIKRRHFKWGMASTIVLLLAIPALTNTLSARISAYQQKKSADIRHQSVGARAYHALNGLNILSQKPIAVLTGIGPGRYGDYASKTGQFPRTVTMQVLLANWLVEFGFLWTALAALWLWQIGRRARKSFGWMGIWCLLGLLAADGFQANWKWESWFFALAFLYATHKKYFPIQFAETRDNEKAASRTAAIGSAATHR